jgi:FdhE protein
MPIGDARTARWDARIARARTLAADHAASAELLDFYACLAERQRTVVLSASGRLLAGGDRQRQQGARVGDAATLGGWADMVDIQAAADDVPSFLDWLERTAPPRLAEMARGAVNRCPDWMDLMQESLAHDEPCEPADAAIGFVVEAALQPYVEMAAGRQGFQMPASASAPAGPRCPVCCGRPLAGALREDGQGARRLLVCARCLVEWPYLRIVCAECGEQQFDALPVYTADAFPHVRIEACDSCRSYLKAIDLTKDGLAVPVVDDIASVPLDLWARENGYRRVRANLLRTGDVTGS